MDLHELHDKLLAEGCNRFYIDGIGGPDSDDVDRLGFCNGRWEVYYSERGQRSKPSFSSADKAEAHNFYYNHVMALEHRHLIAFTRSAEVADTYRRLMEKQGIRTVQNDIPHYSGEGDRVYRLFVLGKDVFLARELMREVPFYDEDLKR